MVVWWLVRNHSLYLSDAWNLVRKRRDLGANWNNVTLGGEVPSAEFVPNIELMYTNLAARHRQHVVILAGTDKTDPGKQVKLDSNGEDISGDPSSVISATKDNPFPKFFWYKNCDRILHQNYKRKYKE